MTDERIDALLEYKRNTGPVRGGEVTVDSITDAVTISGTLNVLESTTFNGSRDAFGRARMSQPETLFGAKQLQDKLPLLYDDQQVSGSGTTTSHSTATASTTIGVGATTAGKRVRQSFRRFDYQAGKSQLTLLTGRLLASGGGTDITSGIGLFDDNDGLFWLYDGGTIKVVVRSSTSGSPVDTEVAQSAFNNDTLDGNGPSGVTIDFTKEQIFWIDYEWLGVGTVRYGVVHQGAYILAHSQHHNNSGTSVYMSTPNLPVRYFIENAGTGAASTMEHICATVISEGGQQPDGLPFSVGLGATQVDANSSGTLYAVIGLRLKSTHLDRAITIKSINLISATATDFEWSLWWKPTVANTFTYASVDLNSGVERALGNGTSPANNTVSNGVRIDGGYVKSSASTGSVAADVNIALRLGAAIDGTVDTLVLCVRPLGVNADIYGSISWREAS